jgi:hypothetical protein
MAQGHAMLRKTAKSRLTPALQIGEHDVWWTVALEATLFFSLPAWELIAEPAWPFYHPIEFALALFVGASLAMMACHVVPALCNIGSEPPSGIWSAAISAWVCAVAILVMAKTAGRAGFVVFLQNTSAGRWLAATLAISLAAAAWMSPQWIKRSIVLCGTLGIAVLFTALLFQSSGLRPQEQLHRNIRFTEDTLDDPQKLIIGILLAAAPASMFAARIGRMGISSRRIYITGFVGVWVPLMLVGAMACLAKAAGVRLHWVPSLPFVFVYALVDAEGHPGGLFKLGCLASLSTLIVCAHWVREMTDRWNWRWKPIAIPLVVGALVYCTDAIPQYFFFYSDDYYLCVSSLVVGVSMLGLLSRTRPETNARNSYARPSTPTRARTS